MGITIRKPQLEAVLERAIILAESNEELPDEWRVRVERISSCPSRSYTAALGTALLAKAADETIDALTVKSSAGARAYSMRGVVKVLAERATHYGYHLGVTGPEPLNNQPWFGMKRVDEAVDLADSAKPFHRDMIRFLKTLNTMNASEAERALAMFLRLRLAYAESLRREQNALRATGTADFGALLSVIDHFVSDDPEGGRRGQALVAALLDLIYEDVYLAPINDPTSFDVKVQRDGVMLLGVEVKQKPVTEAAAHHLAEATAASGADKALVVAIAIGQRPLDDESIQRSTLERHGVLTFAFSSVSRLVSEIVLHAPLTAAEVAKSFPNAYLRRMIEHQVSAEGRQHWVDLCAGLGQH